MTERRLTILGTRGIPGRHGGFETFAQHLALHLVQRGWSVTVYCQEVGSGPVWHSDWQGVQLVHIPTRSDNALGTILFDLRAAWRARRTSDVVLVLGYNTAIFNVVNRVWGNPVVMNMDGIEWQRQKWGRFAKLWLRINEWLGCRIANHLVADHPAIESHLQSVSSRAAITMIPYGADEVDQADVSRLVPYHLEQGQYALVIARPEPENSILEIVRGFPADGWKLVVLGSFDPVGNVYHRQVQQASGDNVLFPGALYDADLLATLRFFCGAYIHGHQVGGTNPSLVEALGAGCAIIARDNPFNRWVAGDSANYFTDEESLGAAVESIRENPDTSGQLSTRASRRFQENFRWSGVLAQYEQLLQSHLPADD